MRKKYHVLRSFIVILKILAFLAPLDMLYRWYQARSLLVQMTEQLNQLSAQLNQTLEQLNQLNGLAASLGIPLINLGSPGAPNNRVLVDLPAEDINRVVSAILIGVALWALSEYLSAHLAIEENTRGAFSLLWRLVRHEIPGEEPEYLKSLHGVWDDSPPARVPNEQWKRTPVTDAMKTVDLDDKNRIFRHSPSPVKNDPPKPAGNYRAFRRQKGPGDPPSW